MSQTTRRVVLAARPAGLPREADFRIEEASAAEPADGQVLIRTLYVSVDPYMRGRMNDGESYIPAFALGEPICGMAVGEVTASRTPHFAVGDVVEGMLPWVDVGAVGPEGLRRVDPKLAPVSSSLGVLGMPGLSAYFGLLAIGKPVAGETVLVSGAAGAVGSLAGQIAKIKGCRTIGVAGGDDKVRHLTAELGFDGAYNYKAAKDHRNELARLCPDGIDVYFDNVGGPVSDAALTLINRRARISLCGQISQYNLERGKPEMGPRLLFMLIAKEARMEGWLVMSFRDQYPVALAELASWYAAGHIKLREHVTDGLENAPRAFIGMLTGENTGKALVRVASL